MLLSRLTRLTLRSSQLWHNGRWRSWQLHASGHRDRGKWTFRNPKTMGREHDKHPPVPAAYEADLLRLAHLFDDRKNLTPRIVRTDPGQILDPLARSFLSSLHTVVTPIPNHVES